MVFEAMRKLAIASTYSGSSYDSTTFQNPPIPYTQNTHILYTHAQQTLPSSLFSNAYNSFFAPPAISYSTPAPSVVDTSPAHIEEVPHAVPDAPVVSAVLPSSYQPFVLSGDPDSSGSTEDVSPISVPHLIWKAQI